MPQQVIKPLKARAALRSRDDDFVGGTEWLRSRAAMSRISARLPASRCAKRLRLLICGLAVMVLTALTASPGFAEDEFCWRDSYGRGVGTVPKACQEGRDRIGLLCYTKCPADMKRVGFDCHSVCPSGMRDDGLFCRATEYGRGAGYPIWDGGKCKRAHGECEKSGALWYPKCKPGYSAFGCCICRPKKPDCTALGLKPGIDLSCAKKITIGDPVAGACASGEQRQAGLCYKACKPGYGGLGPVCWGQPPPGWSECGMGAAKDSKTCASMIWNQVSSVGQMAFNLAAAVASLGTSTAATGGTSAAANASKLSKLQEELAQLQSTYNKIKQIPEVQKAQKAFEAANQGYEIGTKGKELYDAAKNPDAIAEEIARKSAEYAAILDPTGIAGTVAAYTYPKCSKLGYSPTGQPPEGEREPATMMRPAAPPEAAPQAQAPEPPAPEAPPPPEAAPQEPPAPEAPPPPEAAPQEPPAPEARAPGVPAPEGYLKLQTKFLESQNKCLEGNQVAKGAMLGGAAFMAPCSNANGQTWKMVPVEPGSFKLQTAFLESKNKCLQGSEDEVFGAAAFMATCDDGWGQMWKMVPTKPGYFRLQTKFFESDNMCLEGNQVAQGAMLGGAAFMAPCSNAVGQAWKMVPVSEEKPLAAPSEPAEQSAPDAPPEEAPPPAVEEAPSGDATTGEEPAMESEAPAPPAAEEEAAPPMEEPQAEPPSQEPGADGQED